MKPKALPAIHSSPPLSASADAVDAVEPPQRSNAIRRLWLMAPLLYAVVGWSLAGGYLVGQTAQQVIEIAGILGIGAAGLVLGFYVRSQSADLERSYAAHLEELSLRFRNLAYTDSLTDLYNHRYFHEQLGHEVERAIRYGGQVSVILMDLDHFKAVNDTYGHLMGDKLLTLIGKIIKNHVRGADIPARYGGDEFAIILPDTSPEAAETTASKLARSISSGRIGVGSLSESIPLSTSYAVATCPSEASTVPDLMELVDGRLYAAKGKRPALEERALAG